MNIGFCPSVNEGKNVGLWEEMGWTDIGLTIPEPLESLKWGLGSGHKGRHLFGLMVPVLTFRG